jgi:hypothetical protein
MVELASESFHRSQEKLTYDSTGMLSPYSAAPKSPDPSYATIIAIFKVFDTDADNRAIRINLPSPSPSPSPSRPITVTPPRLRTSLVALKAG